MCSRQLHTGYLQRPLAWSRLLGCMTTDQWLPEILKTYPSFLKIYDQTGSGKLSSLLMTWAGHKSDLDWKLMRHVNAATSSSQPHTASQVDSLAAAEELSAQTCPQWTPGTNKNVTEFKRTYCNLALMRSFFRHLKQLQLVLGQNILCLGWSWIPWELKKRSLFFKCMCSRERRDQ